jgi:hypothetical protein
MVYEVLEDRLMAHCWRVEWTDPDNEGACFAVSFAGAGAKGMAIEYAEWRASTNPKALVRMAP